jgi:hypothetical protein
VSLDPRARAVVSLGSRKCANRKRRNIPAGLCECAIFRSTSVQGTTLQRPASHQRATVTDKTWHCLLHKTASAPPPHTHTVTVNITQVISCGLTKTLVKYKLGGTAVYLAY